MPNNYFRFKQFTVHQEHCAMKVCTDACLFGAWAAHKTRNHIPITIGTEIRNALDIGTGTGLLSLMYAQKNDEAIIDAVEIDEAAAMQAKENFAASPWKERLHVYNMPIQQFNLSTNQPLYDLVISNPPFFENDLKSDDNKRNLALHSAELSLEELLFTITRLLKDEGNFAMLLPHHRSDYFEQLARTNNYFLHEKVLVKQTPKHDYFRSMLLFGKRNITATEKEIIIKEEAGIYTAEFAALLKDYYLYL